MAEILSANSNSGKRGTKSKKLSTRVDLTPMVDLGFLLITFFIFTTTMSNATTIRLTMPDDRTKTDKPTTISDSKTLNIELAGNNRIYYYQGLDEVNKKETNYSSKGIRSVIQNMQQTVARKFGNPTETVILIRPTKDASYQNIVNVLDEMTINGVTRYVLMGEEK